jgi:hypothetical protein
VGWGCAGKEEVRTAVFEYDWERLQAGVGCVGPVGVGRRFVG